LAVFGLTEPVGVESQSSALPGSFGSIHRYISCGRKDGVYVARSGGFTGLAARSKKRMLNLCAGCGHTWITRLQRKDMAISSFCAGHTRSSREVWPTFAPVTNSFPNSPTTVGLAGLAMSTTRMPGWTCVQVPSGFVGVSTGLTPGPGSESPHEFEPSLRFPT